MKGHEITDEHIDHCERIIDKATERMRRKYIAGVAKYGSNLWEYQVIDLVKEALHEAIDQVIYLETLLDRMNNDAKG
jgi:hypothetical protein